MWSDTTGTDKAAHKARCKLRDKVAECVCLFHIVLITVSGCYERSSNHKWLTLGPQFYAPLPIWLRFALIAVEGIIYLAFTAPPAANTHAPEVIVEEGGGTLSKSSLGPSKERARDQTPHIFSWFSSSKKKTEDFVAPYEDLREINRRSPTPEAP